MSGKDEKPKTPEERFASLARKRLPRALAYLRLVGNLSDRSNYKYTDEQKKEIINELRKALRDVEHRFARKRNIDNKKFKTF